MGTWTPILERIATLDGKGVVHAGPPGMEILPDRRVGRKRMRQTAPTACGMKRTRPYAVCMITPEDEKAVRVLSWPPRVAVLRRFDLKRCRECFTETGSPRPEPIWDQIVEVPEDQEGCR